MSLLVSRDALLARRAVAGGGLKPLADGLRAELAPLIANTPVVPTEKAMLSREGGRCAVDGTLLTFDPFSTRHRCSVCGREFAGYLHDRFRLYWYQLWLAERTVHAALLGVLLEDAACTRLAVVLLDELTERYPSYPNVDNVLGPSRPFFSTYLESIWLLQLVIALDTLECGAPSSDVSILGNRMRDRLIAPSMALIASYDEGMSNRQVWNNAALLAASRLLGRNDLFDRALHGGSGLHAHLEHALLPDGSWYEGENYHLFAHRGLWYGVQLARAAGHRLGTQLDDRYHEGFIAPFRTVLPDLTYPSRRDSQYAVSVRQPRFAESCELGIADREDPRLVGMLARLYAQDIPRGDTGRATTSADAERNVPATALDRSDLSWRSLLCARDTLPAGSAEPLGSDLLPSQGIGILRRRDGQLYVSLDYGQSGGGHGHPDRLNLTLQDGTRRWFDDPGTGSYVDRSLHWYRSTLAHHAPLVDGHSQRRVHGQLLAFDDRGDVGIVSAVAPLAPGLEVRRTLLLCGDEYLLDELSWDGDTEHEVALPIHGVELGAECVASREPTKAPCTGDAEDGFEFLSNVEHIATRDATAPLHITATRGNDSHLDGWLHASKPLTLMRALAPAAPGRGGPVPMLLACMMARTGSLVSLWTWNGAVTGFTQHGDRIDVARADGAHDIHTRGADAWKYERRRASTGSRAQDSHASVTKEFALKTTARTASPATDGQSASSAASVSSVSNSESRTSLPETFHLGEANYRRSEQDWHEARKPTADVIVALDEHRRARIEIDVPRSERLFVNVDAVNHLDNEPAAINGDGIQLYALASNAGVGVLLVPSHGDVGIRPIAGWPQSLPLAAVWRATAYGYRVTVTLDLPRDARELALDVIVNETTAGRARRRGQLVMSGAAGEFIYLRGDRHDPSRLIHFSLPHD